MKKIMILPLILSFIFTHQTFSQNAGQDKKQTVQDNVSQQGIEWAKSMTQRVDQICDLTPEQEKQIMEVNLRYADKMQEAQQNSEMSQEAVNAHKDKLFEARMGEYNSILNKDQQDKLKAYRDELRDEGQSNGNNSDKKEEVKDKAQDKGYSKEETKEKAKRKKDDKKNDDQ